MPNRPRVDCWNGTTSLTFTIANPNAAAALTGVGFTDTFPAGLVVAMRNGLAGSCGGGTITATAGSGAVSLTGATLAASASCAFSANVTGNAVGMINNTTGAVTSIEGGTGGTASASLAVVAVVQPPANIPTLRQWALWLLSLLLLIVTALWLRPRRREQSKQAAVGTKNDCLSGSIEHSWLIERIDRA